MPQIPQAQQSPPLALRRHNTPDCPLPRRQHLHPVSPPKPARPPGLTVKKQTRLFVIAQGDDNLKCETVGCAAGTACTDHANTAAVAAAAESVNDASFCPVICTLQTLPRTAKQLSVTTGLTRSDVSFPASAFLIPVAQTSRPQPHVESPPAPNILAKTEK
ncbi:predicted protein [Plenodomus lingam JN3]|uniref:Predicted protein n=1 Tax=Leptosphaeria maculans (strain JN3 / isolate v23.1.3 / race Av1-4-5-6-7-8) TaxID=985895 RepID=E5AA80_LEPMJ|nr:predicted protein [Plenodomus lingam JN3]CBY00571.1 predicted protein [Plenodomus lingam JN3]